MAETKPTNRDSKVPVPPMNLPTDKDGNIIREVSGHEDRSVPQAKLYPEGPTGAAMKALGLGGPKEIAPEDDDGVSPIGPDQGIAVKAIREGFFRNQRLMAGDFFNIPNMSAWGDWMVLADDKAEAQRQADIKAAKLQAKEDAKKADAAK